MTDFLSQYPALKSYYLSESHPQPTFKSRLQDWYKDPMIEVYLLFYQAVLPVFNNFNLILQQEEPSIHLIGDEMISFIKKLHGKYLSLDQLKNTSSLLQANVLNQVSDSKLFIGFLFSSSQIL